MTFKLCHNDCKFFQYRPRVAYIHISYIYRYTYTYIQLVRLLAGMNKQTLIYQKFCQTSNGIESNRLNISQIQLVEIC